MSLRKIIFILLAFSCIATANAQTINSDSLQGKIVDSNGYAVAGAVVTCITLPDSTIVGYGVANGDGLFEITADGISHENLLLEASCLGYEKSRIKPPDDNLVITLKESASELHEVVVTASAERLQQKPGKFIFKPSASEVKSIDSYDLLRFTPLVSIEDNAVSILGKGASSVFINGRKPVMDKAAVMEMLRSTPADRIEKVEIITSPNSSHKASTQGGIVNIVMKKNANEGLTGSATAGATYLGEELSPRTSLYLGYSKDKFNASANVSYQHHNMQNKTEATYNYADSHTDIVNAITSKTDGNFLNGNVSLSYDFTKHSTLGASFHIGGSESHSSSTTLSTNYRNGAIDKHSKSYSATENPFRKPEMSLVAYYNIKTDDKGSKLDMSANYSSSANASWGSMEYASGADASALAPYSLFKQNSTVDSYGYEFKGSYNHAFDDGSSLESGYEFNSSHLSNDFIRNDHNGSEYERNNRYCNLFDYDEKVNALYVSYDREWSDAFSTTLGLRMENTDIKGNQVSTDEQFHNNYLNFFPNISLLVYLAEGDHSLSIDLSRSIVRPFYNDLNPFKTWTSENTYSMGNIHLKPMIYNDVDFCYTLLGDYILGASYSYGTDAFGEYSFMSENNTTVSSVANFGSEQSLSLYCNVVKAFFKGKWRISLNASADYETTQGSIDSNDVSYDTWTGAAGIRNIFNLSSLCGVRATLSYNYYTPSKGIFKVGRHKHLLNASLSKDFKFGGTLSINANNMLNYRPASHFNSASYSYNYTPKTDNVALQVSYTQKFGQSRVRGAQNRSDTNHLGRFRTK